MQSYLKEKMSLNTLLTKTEIRGKEESVFGIYFSSSIDVIFPPEGYANSQKRQIELRLSISELEDSDNPKNEILPLTVWLIEKVENMRYEDIYYFTHDNRLISHGWRHSRKSCLSSGYQFLNQEFEFDRDMQKLQHYGYFIQELLSKEKLDWRLNEHPTVIALKRNEIWKLPLH